MAKKESAEKAVRDIRRRTRRRHAPGLWDADRARAALRGLGEYRHRDTNHRPRHRRPRRVERHVETAEESAVFQGPAWKRSQVLAAREQNGLSGLSAPTARRWPAAC